MPLPRPLHRLAAPGSVPAKAIALGTVLVVAALSLMPHVSLPDSAPSDLDLLIHLVMQGALGFTVIHAWPRHLRWTALILASLVVGLEVGQIPVPGREFAIDDLLTNALGAGLGATVACWLAHRRAR